MTDTDLEAWMAARPHIIRHLARQYPPGRALDIESGRWYVVSYEALFRGRTPLTREAEVPV
jgi:hypothetical protein